MDANTQIANDLHLLTAPIRFLFRCVLALIFLLLAPLIYATLPFACIAADPNSDFSILALAYMALAPFENFSKSINGAEADEKSSVTGIAKE